jgi:phosphoribosylformylglycinamidine synthase subunit PurL
MEPENEFFGFDIEQIPEPENIEEVIYSLMVNPNLTPLNYFNDFSEIIPDPKKIGSDSDESGIFELEDGTKLLAMTTHAMHHHLESDPQKAAEILVSRATRKMVCYGAKPIAVSAMLYHINYSDPNEQFIAAGAKIGLENAAKAYNLKIADRKIRFDFFGELGQQSPTIIVSLLGSLKKGKTGDFKKVRTSFKQKGNNIFLIGKISDNISTSDYLEFYHGITDSPLPDFDLDFETKVINVVDNLIENDLITNATPVAKGGVFFTLLRSCWLNGLGFDITTAAEVRTDSFLFGEAMGRIIVGVSKDKEDDFVDFMFESKVPFFTLGHVTRGEIRIDDESYGFIDKMTGSL